MDYHTYLHLFHIFIVSVLFIYVGINREKSVIPKEILIVLGIVVLGYHLYRHKSWINYFHAFIVAPLLIYIGTGNAPSYTYDMLLMLAFATLGYHGYKMFM